MVYRCFSTGVHKRKLIPFDVNYLNKVSETINQNPDKDYYESIYLYNDTHLKRFQEKNSLAGITDVKTDRLVFDFDSKNDVQKAVEDAQSVVDLLINKYDVLENAVRIFYSGSKGMHVEVHLNETLSRPEFENIVETVAGNLETFDTAIKDQQRLFRFPLTKNDKTKRFKIPLTINQLFELNLDQIQKLANHNDEPSFYDILDSYVTTELSPSLKLMKNASKKEKLKSEVTIEQTDTPDMSRKPKHLTPAKYVIQEGYFDEGERNEACMILSSTYKYLGYNKEHAYNMLKATLRLRSHRLGIPEYDKEELWKTIIEPVFSPLWKGGVYSEEEGLLAKTIKKYKLDKISIQDVGLVSLNSVADYFKDFAVNIDKNTIRLGIKEIDERVRVTTSMLVCLLAAPGAGKTSISLGILNTISNNEEKAIFFSLDMGVPQVYQRIIQRHTGEKADKILENYKNNNVQKINEYNEALTTEYKNIKFCFKSGMTTEHIKESLIYERDKSGSIPKLIVIDYLECIQGPFSDSNANKALIATQLKDIANEFSICVFLLVQPAKQSGDPSQELLSYTQIKGSSVLGEASSVVFTMYRPGFSPKSPDRDKYLTINVVKNRMGELSSTDLGWTGLTGNIHSLSNEEKRDLNQLRADLAAAEQNGDSDELYSKQTSGKKYGDLY